MKVEYSAQMLLPTVRYGNLTLFTKMILDSENANDLTAAGAKSSEEMPARARELTVKELTALKNDIDRLLNPEDYTLEKFPDGA